MWGIIQQRDGFIAAKRKDARQAGQTAHFQPGEKKKMRKVAKKVRRNTWRVTRELETADYIAWVAVVIALMTFISFFRICILGA